MDALQERFWTFGEEACTDAELVDLVLGTKAENGGGARGEEVVASFGGLRALARARAAELRTSGGVGERQATSLAAAFALGRRAARAEWSRADPVRCGREVFEFFRPRLRGLRKETFYALLLDGKNRLLREERVSEGTLTSSLVHPREVFAPAVRESAASLIVVHNHPSGDPTPSPEDREVTRRLRAAGEIVGIRVLDHVVVGEEAYVSFLEKGWL
ncbi:MAG TPA: DNA repair protein RadC [Planctomycetota bacterium]|jgi:DNA repair protein RadC|nr:DNA repair protein RadC [Planctomycetota bacterium]